MMENPFKVSISEMVTKFVISTLLTTLVYAPVICLIPGLIVKWLWNLFVPELLSLPCLTYWQAFGLCLIFWILFGFTNVSFK